MAFVTEPILTSLANYLGNYANMPSPTESQFPSLHEIEIKYGLMQLMEGLQFLHSDVKMIHRNICPESIIINNENCWKIFGFDYCCLLTADPETGKISGNQQAAYVQGNRVSLLQPLLEYAAPEWIIDTQQFCSSDVYSLGENRVHLKSIGNLCDIEYIGVSFLFCRRSHLHHSLSQQKTLQTVWHKL